MQKYQPIKTISFRPDGTAFADAEGEQLGWVGPLLDEIEDNDQQLEMVLSHLEEKTTEMERFVYLNRLCDRNESLFYKVLLSDCIRFLLSSDSRRRLLEISYICGPSGHMHISIRHGASRVDAA